MVQRHQLFDQLGLAVEIGVAELGQAGANLVIGADIGAGGRGAEQRRQRECERKEPGANRRAERHGQGLA